MPPRYATRIDEAQPEIVNGLRKMGASVQSLAKIGEGCPDLMVGYRGDNFIFEIKTPDSAHSKRGLNVKHPTPKKQQAWYDSWRGRVDVIENFEQARFIVTGRGKPFRVVHF